MFNPFRVAALLRCYVPQVLPVAIVIQSFQDCFADIVRMDGKDCFIFADKPKSQRDFTIIATGATRG